MRRLIAVAAAVLAIAGGCAASPESPWAADRDTFELPPPTTEGATSVGANGAGTAATRVISRDCFHGELSCGLVAVPQIDGAQDRVTLEFRVLSDTGAGTPLVQLLDGTDERLVSPDAFPDRPLIQVGARGFHPAGPSLSCPEFYRATSNAEFGEMVGACAERLRLAGIDPAGTVPTVLGHDVAAVLETLGYDEVDLLVPSWRALATPAIAARVDVRRVVYTSPWFADDRATTPGFSALASMDAVWAACTATPECSAPGTVDDFLAAVRSLDQQPLDDVTDTLSDDPRPIDSQRLIAAVLSNGDAPSSLAFLPRLHQAILDRDHETVSSYVQGASSNSTEINLLGVTCSLFDPTAATAAGLPSPLREDAEDTIDIFERACAVWPADGSADEAPIPGLTILTRSAPLEGADYATALAAGPVVVEPTIGPPTTGCVEAVAGAWFDREEVDDSACTSTLRLDGSNDDVILVLGTYEAAEVTIELDVPSTWSDSGYGTWWRDADPIDMTNLDVYVWGAVDASAARTQVIDEWGLLDSELSSIQVGRQIWLLATGTDETGTVYRVATADIGDTNLAVILQSDAEESARLADVVLMPALNSLRIR